MEKITFWIARDKDMSDKTCLYMEKPFLREGGMWDNAQTGFIALPEHYALKPGERKKVTLIIS